MDPPPTPNELSQLQRPQQQQWRSVASSSATVTVASPTVDDSVTSDRFHTPIRYSSNNNVSSSPSLQNLLPPNYDVSKQRTTTTSSRPSTSTAPIIIQQEQPLRTQQQLQQYSRNSAKIIKGEIHNVLTVMRADPRYYYSNIGGSSTSTSRSRFEYEERQQQFHWSGRWGSGISTSISSGSVWHGSSFTSSHGNDWKMHSNDVVDSTTSTAASGTISSHPILQGLRELHDFLSVMEVDRRSINNYCSTSSSSHQPSEKHHRTRHTPPRPPPPLTINAATFVLPFAAAVCSRDVDAKTTASALSALHKFIVYGFVGGQHYDENEEYNNKYEDSHNSSIDDVRESISIVARCIRQCSFEDSTRKPTAEKGRISGGGFLSLWSNAGVNSQPETLNEKGDKVQDCKSDYELPSFLTQARRSSGHKSSHDKGTASNNNNSNISIVSSSYYTKPYTSLSPPEEDVVLKLLSLSVQVLRCPAGRNLLPPEDIIGIFDTCLYVAIAAQEAKRSLLRTAAADALSHCVIVVFEMRGRQQQQQQRQHRCRNSDSDGFAGDGADSDDDWGERDPSEDVASDELLLVRKSLDESDDVQDLREMSQTNDAEIEDNNSSIPSPPPDRETVEEPALVAIMHRLATLADPLLHEDNTCILALSLINIALETMSDVDALSVRYPRLLNILQNDLCRNLLRLSTSTDLTILGLALRVIFNLFNGIKDHMKVQLEVFLTSVHLRILSFSIAPTSNERTWSAPPERRELALESLLEFCREPMLMADLYMNYDCDINCTNLFETICSTLAKVANPDNGCSEQRNTTSNCGKKYDVPSDTDGVLEMDRKPRLNILNRLALEGVLAVVDGIARRCRASSKYEGTAPGNSAHLHPMHHISTSPPDNGTEVPENALDINGGSLPAGGSIPINDSEYDFCSVSTSSLASALHDKVPLVRNDSSISDDTDWLSKAQHHTSLALQERKLHKRRIAKVAAKFNEQSKDREWIEVAERVGILPTPATPSSIASFLFSTPKLDKAKIGLYLSKGPKEQYPFHSEVLVCFAALFDFSGMSFSDALRTFLGRFRLPGEAQCIDRLMEAFAVRLYEVQMSSETVIPDIDQSVEKAMLDLPNGRDTDCEERIGMLDPPAASDEDAKKMLFPFKSSDASFIMSFSSIMLNTDLHNPNMKDEKRMTLDQFVRNNRGINGGADLPIEFLTNLYYEIKNNEIQVERDFLQDGAGGADAFDGLLAKAIDVATPFFTSNDSTHPNFTQAGVHERDMYICISTTAVSAISTVFIESWDDVLVKKALDGLRNSANICFYFGLNEQFNQILDKLLGFGLDYIDSVANLVNTTPVNWDVGTNAENDIEAELVSRNIPRLPTYFLSTLSNEWNHDAHIDVGDLVGCAAHRGLLSLHCALSLSKNHLSILGEAWSTLLEVMFALRDLSALPSGLSDLDDFADSRGNRLPKSPFANACHHRVNEYRHSLAPTVNSSNKVGFLASIFGRKPSSNRNEEHPFPLSAVFEKVAQFAQLEKIIMKTNDTALAKRILTAMLGSMFPDGEEYDEMISDALFEHNSVFVLELAARLLISNRVHAAVLYPVFYSKFVTVLSPQSTDPDNPTMSLIAGLKFPYILERIVVTILRACIHFFDAPVIGLRDQLLRSLDLIATLPSSYTSAISDRIGCGAAIILRACFYLFDEKTDGWSTIKCLLDLAAQERTGRGFVFDGIASVIDSIDYAIPSNDTRGDGLSADQKYNQLQLSQSGVEVMASLLLKFMNGSYNDDLSYKAPSIFLIKKLYSFSQHFSDRSTTDSVSVDALLQANEFETMVTAIYNDACLSNDATTAKKGFESLQGMVVSTPTESIPVSKWLNFLRTVASNPPKIDSPGGRANHLSLLGRLFLTLVPDLSNKKENWTELEELTIAVAEIVRDNLQSGRAKPLFETTVQTVTNVVNVLSLSGVKEGEVGNFCVWVGETLLSELERVGACGGETSLVSAARKTEPT